MEGLIEGEFRRPGLTAKTLQRQMKRMAGKELTKAAHQRYCDTYWAGKKSGGTGRESWTVPADKRLIEIGIDPPDFLSRETGREVCEQIDKILVEEGLRKNDSKQAVRHRYRTIMEWPYNKRRGLTKERWMRLNEPRKYFKMKEAENVLDKATAPVSDVSEGNVMVTSKNGFRVELNATHQAKALEEFLTPEKRAAAYQWYVDNRLMRG